MTYSNGHKLSGVGDFYTEIDFNLPAAFSLCFFSLCYSDRQVSPEVTQS